MMKPNAIIVSVKTCKNSFIQHLDIWSINPTFPVQLVAQTNL